jgi:hypothetical protein
LAIITSDRTGGCIGPVLAMAQFIVNTTVNGIKVAKRMSWVLLVRICL